MGSFYGRYECVGVRVLVCLAEGGDEECEAEEGEWRVPEAEKVREDLEGCAEEEEGA